MAVGMIGFFLTGIDLIDSNFKNWKDLAFWVSLFLCVVIFLSGYLKIFWLRFFGITLVFIIGSIDEVEDSGMGLILTVIVVLILSGYLFNIWRLKEKMTL